MADRMDALHANGADEIKARRYRSTLFNIGTGIVAFCAWSVVRMAAFIVGSMPSFRESALEAARESGGEVSEGMFLALTILFLVLVVAVDIFLRFYIGMRARAQARGKKCSGVYLVIACLMIVGSMFLILAGIAVCVWHVMYAAGYTSGILPEALSTGLQEEEAAAAAEGSAASGAGGMNLTGIFIEFTSMILMVELVVNAVRVRRMERAHRRGLERAPQGRLMNTNVKKSGGKERP